MKIEIRAIGKMRGAMAELFAEYQKRLGNNFSCREYEAPKGLAGTERQKKEAAFLLDKLPQGTVIALDERGQNVSSAELAEKLEAWLEQGSVTFLLGGADGHAPEVRERADVLLAFGKQTWPHMLARLMLIEQVYRARQISAGHPYHRE